jgi:hypothetical protein
MKGKIRQNYGPEIEKLISLPELLADVSVLGTDSQYRDIFRK